MTEATIALNAHAIIISDMFQNHALTLLLTLRNL